MRSDPIAVTGLGLVTSLGNSLDDTWRQLSAGTSGSRMIEHFPTHGLPTRFAAFVDDLKFSGENPQEKGLAIGRSVADEASSSAGLSRADFRRVRSQLFVATPHSEPFLLERAEAFADAQSRRIDDRRKSRLYRSNFAGVLAADTKSRLGIGGLPITVTTACASGASAVQLALEAIRRSAVDIAVVIASDASVFPEGILRFSLLSALSTRNDDPARASRPFSKDRDGFVMGEGGACLVLETLNHVGSRNGPIHGIVVGAGDATDNFHRTRSHPSGRSIVKCMANAVTDAGLSLADIGYVNAHGTSTPENDKMEALGLRELFGSRVSDVPVSSNKSMIGHTLSAAGAIEAVVTLKSLSEGLAPPTINHIVPDEDIGLDVIPNTARPISARYALSNSFGFGGQNVALILGSTQTL